MRLYGLIGYPLAHSFSREYFTRKFAELGITDCNYLPFPIKSIGELRDILVNTPDLQGFNVTIPYKEEILKLLNSVSSEASAIGAINCVKIEKRGTSLFLYGYNTDASGFRDSLTPLLQRHHTEALVLGTGGASKAVCHVLNELHIETRLVSRAPSAGQLAYSQIGKKEMQRCTLIVNTTPLGMSPRIGQFPAIPYQFLSSDHLLYDLIYNPSETEFLKKGKAAGAAIKNGLEMLELQADKSWEIWNTAC